MIRKLLPCVLVVIMPASRALAQRPVVDVVKGAGKKISFAVSGFEGDASIAGPVTETLKNDLRLSGYFQLATASNAELIQRGVVRVEKGNGFIDCSVVLSATKQVVFSKTYQGSTQDLRRMVHVLSDDLVQTIVGQKGIAQTKIAFVWDRGGVKELAVMDYDGHNVRQLTYDKKISVRPRWAPNGRKIVYTGYLKLFPDVIEVDLVTGQRKTLAAFPGLNTGATYSPNGEKLALTLSKDGNPELYVMNADGKGLKRLTNTRGAESSPTWTPDGEHITYVSDDRGSPQVYMINVRGGEPVRLTTSPSYNTEPDWSRPPSGSNVKPMLALTSRVGGKFQIGIYNSETQEVVPLVADGNDDQDPSWAPNGRHLVFAKTRNWRSKLYILDVATREEIELSAVDGNAYEPAWGP